MLLILVSTNKKKTIENLKKMRTIFSFLQCISTIFTLNIGKVNVEYISALLYVAPALSKTWCEGQHAAPVPSTYI